MYTIKKNNNNRRTELFTNVCGRNSNFNIFAAPQNAKLATEK